MKGHSMDLQGKTIFITGAAKRLGRALALALAEAGADLILHVYSSSPDEVVQKSKQCGRQVAVVSGDLASLQEVERVARDALQLSPVDVVINNAALFLPTPLEKLEIREWQQIMHVNLTAPFALSLILGKEMKRRGGGKIIQLGDWSGQRPVRGYLPYCVSKGGVHILTLALAKALAPRVQVNEVVLGPVLPPASYDTGTLNTLQQQTPLRRIGAVSDVVRAVRFLIESNEFVTGAAYRVDGGWLSLGPGGMETSL